MKLNPLCFSSWFSRRLRFYQLVQAVWKVWWSGAQTERLEKCPFDFAEIFFQPVQVLIWFWWNSAEGKSTSVHPSTPVPTNILLHHRPWCPSLSLLHLFIERRSCWLLQSALSSVYLVCRRRSSSTGSGGALKLDYWCLAPHPAVHREGGSIGDGLLMPSPLSPSLPASSVVLQRFYSSWRSWKVCKSEWSCPGVSLLSELVALKLTETFRPRDWTTHVRLLFFL